MIRDSLYVWDREVVAAGSPCPCGATKEISDVSHHRKTGNKLVSVRCRECRQEKSTIETFRR